MPLIALAMAFVLIAQPAKTPAETLSTDLRTLQGSWYMKSLIVGGNPIPMSTGTDSEITIMGDRFLAGGMGAVYSGYLKLYPGRRPKQMDMKFTAGPEAGKASLAVYSLEKGAWTICLGFAGKPRPAGFSSTAENGAALEVFTRQRREDVTAADRKALQGEWTLISGERSGQPLSAELVRTGKRTATGSKVQIAMLGRTYLEAYVALNGSKTPREIDYLLYSGPESGARVHGIYEVNGDTARFCFAPPGGRRPQRFATRPGDGLTVTTWRRVGAAEKSSGSAD